MGAHFDQRLAALKDAHPIVGDVRGKGSSWRELVKDRATKEPFLIAGEKVYQYAFRKGLAWCRQAHPAHVAPIVMDVETAAKGMDLIEECHRRGRGGVRLRSRRAGRRSQRAGTLAAGTAAFRPGHSAARPRPLHCSGWHAPEPQCRSSQRAHE